jgi:hypothetical protein
MSFNITEYHYNKCCCVNVKGAESITAAMFAIQKSRSVLFQTIGHDLFQIECVNDFSVSVQRNFHPSAQVSQVQTSDRRPAVLSEALPWLSSVNPSNIPGQYLVGHDGFLFLYTSLSTVHPVTRRRTAPVAGKLV